MVTSPCLGSGNTSRPSVVCVLYRAGRLDPSLVTRRRYSPGGKLVNDLPPTSNVPEAPPWSVVVVAVFKPGPMHRSGSKVTVAPGRGRPSSVTEHVTETLPSAA